MKQEQKDCGTGGYVCPGCIDKAFADGLVALRKDYDERCQQFGGAPFGFGITDDPDGEFEFWFAYYARRCAAAYKELGVNDAEVFENVIRFGATVSAMAFDVPVPKAFNDGYDRPEVPGIPFRSHEFPDDSGIVWAHDQIIGGPRDGEQKVFFAVDTEDTTEMHEWEVDAMDQIARFGGQHAEEAKAMIRRCVASGQYNVQVTDEGFVAKRSWE